MTTTSSGTRTRSRDGARGCGGGALRRPATLELRHDARYGGPVVELRPSDPSATPVAVFVDLDILSVSLGRYATTFELWDARRHGADLRECVAAVVDGRYDERVWLEEGEPVKVVGTFHLADGDEEASRGTAWWVRRQPDERIRYAPYVPRAV